MKMYKNKKDVMDFTGNVKNEFEVHLQIQCSFAYVQPQIILHSFKHLFFTNENIKGSVNIKAGTC